MAPQKILVIDDDKGIVQLIEYALQNVGFEVLKAFNGEEGLYQVQENHPDLVLLDIMMPVVDGWTTCRRIRELSNVPIIMLTALTQERDVVRALELGADDYIVKTDRRQEIVARVRACLRRSKADGSEGRTICYADEYLSFDLALRHVVVNGRTVDLTPTEFNLLAQLIQSAGHVLSYRELLERVWGWEYADEIDYLRVYIWHLRKKIERDSQNPCYILTEHGTGYYFAKGSAHAA